jgi:hypothetical protein
LSYPEQKITQAEQEITEADLAAIHLDLETDAQVVILRILGHVRVWCVPLELTFGCISKAAAEAKAKAEAHAAAEANEKLRELLVDFGLENEVDGRALAAFQVRTVADLHLLGREDVNKVLPVSHVSRENFVKLLEHVGAPEFLSPEENSLGQIKYCRDRAAKGRAALSAWSAKAARSVPQLSRMWPGEDIPSHIAGGIRAAETSHPTDETAAHLALELTRPPSHVNRVWQSNLLASLKNIGVSVHSLAQTSTSNTQTQTRCTNWHTCYTNSFGIYAHNKQHQARACQKKTASITIILMRQWSTARQH